MHTRYTSRKKGDSEAFPRSLGPWGLSARPRQRGTPVVLPLEVGLRGIWLLGLTQRGDSARLELQRVGRHLTQLNSVPVGILDEV